MIFLVIKRGICKKMNNIVLYLLLKLVFIRGFCFILNTNDYNLFFLINIGYSLFINKLCRIKLHLKI
ncbi:MAG: hypothetical protein EBQ95_05990 [Gammaproteobacteria bacterium]|nr:hypothetical protein [Gammaproteobacteria bacterium]